MPVLKDQPVGFAGMFYLAVDDLEGTFERVREHAEVVKPLTDDHTGQREFYIKDPDGYVIGFNDKAALQSSDLGKYA
ncbi:VOC family protein [Streptomyces sp. NPDC091268]|uniref:VOC family protein n=1 Tax=Streptomyces sp. NPDC091268 TaxID=3365979 RepID=UPI0037F36CA1